jgi:acyl-CoA thioesterase-2
MSADAIDPGDAAPPEGMAHLLAMLELRQLGGDRFAPEYYPEPAAPFVFGGQLAAQSLTACSATVDPGRLPHSLHCLFLAAANPAAPLELVVHRLRDGRSFSTRRVDVVQDAAVVFSATASFNVPRVEPGSADYQVPLPDAPGPDDPQEQWADLLGGAPYFAGLEVRESHPADPSTDGLRAYSRRVWFRTPAALPHDPRLHAAVLAFASDLGVTMASSATAGLYGQAKVLSSLDHGLWIHRPLRVDDWLLLELVSVSNAQSRGLVRGTVHSMDGVLVASVVQEALIR